MVCRRSKSHIVPMPLCRFKRRTALTFRDIFCKHFLWLVTRRDVPFRKFSVGLPAACSLEHRDKSDERDRTSTPEQRNTYTACVGDRPKTFTDLTSELIQLLRTGNGSADERLSRLPHIQKERRVSHTTFK
ncbi:hypothetical protein SCLCIDRAFT_799405 [Scleroderma citrinum Foug A]|uniref:Uncharacterized protein n=1 Tax=Scleroderma citrinum Foug A TaxID=1036808 RepID=A0A0C2ZLG3_9AGAM|nr:hypothetical protein SCLCIDRAFT_799405 [Scleroderma citrinum Foug A]